MNIKKEVTFNTLISFSKNTMNLGYTFLAFAVFPLVHDTIAFYLGLNRPDFSRHLIAL